MPRRPGRRANIPACAAVALLGAAICAGLFIGATYVFAYTSMRFATGQVVGYLIVAGLQALVSFVVMITVGRSRPWWLLMLIGYPPIFIAIPLLIIVANAGEVALLGIIGVPGLVMAVVGATAPTPPLDLSAPTAVAEPHEQRTPRYTQHDAASALEDLGGEA